MSISFSDAYDNDPRNIDRSTIGMREAESEAIIRPKYFKDFCGQKEAVTCLKTYCRAARNRKEPLDHVLLYGSAGLGKTTLAAVIANEMNANMRITSGPAIRNPGDLVALLTNISDGDILFIDDVHRLNRHFYEILFPVMEEFTIDIILGKGPNANSIRLDLPHFTLICATYRADNLNSAFRSRFGIQIKLRKYITEERQALTTYFAEALKLQIDERSIALIAEACDGTPRQLYQLIKRVYDFAQVFQGGVITSDLTKKALSMMEATGLKVRKNESTMEEYKQLEAQ